MLAPRKDDGVPPRGLQDLGDLDDVDAALAFRVTVTGDVKRPMHHVLEDVRVVVLPLGELQQHERAVAGGVEARVGEPEAHVRLRETSVPVSRGQLPGAAGSSAYSQHHAVGGEGAVPGRVRPARVADRPVVHQRRDELLVGADGQVEAVAQLGDVAQHLDAAVALGEHVHARSAARSNSVASRSNGTMRLPA